MTKTEVIAILESLGNDVDFMVGDNTIYVDIVDFIGFTDDWDEEYRAFDNEEAIEQFYTTMEERSKEYEENYYSTYYFTDFKVRVGYTSYDI